MSDIIVHEGKKYRKVERNANVGDLIMIVSAIKKNYPVGAIGKCTRNDEFDDGSIDTTLSFPGSETSGFIDTEYAKYVVLEPVAPDLSALESELAAMKAKVAEMERQLAEVKADELRRATDEEVAEAKRKLIQPGVYVKLQIPEGSRPRYGWGDAKNGDIGKVASRDGDEVRVDFPAQSGWKALIHELVLATEEERKKAEAADKWAAIGRKPGEFKVGDVVRYIGKNPRGNALAVDGFKGIITTIERVSASDVKLTKPAFVKSGNDTWADKDDVELIAPVESVVNLRGGDVV
jgi:hypothetical protein